MLTVDDFARIRHAHRQGMSMRQIARTFGHCRKTVRKALDQPEPKGYTCCKPRRAPQLGRFYGQIDQILTDDLQAPVKQRHTAMQIFRRLRDEAGYVGGYDAIRRYVARCRKRNRPTFIPLDHPPGVRLEADFGHIYVDYPDGRRLVSVLMATWSYSHARFAIKLPSERIEAVLCGLVEALNFFGCVPEQLWWDNPKTIAIKILAGRQRQLHDRYRALVSHYGIDPMACMPAAAWEKPDVEHSVYDLQRRWATPVPQVRDDTELNTYLRRCCEQEMDRTVSGRSESIGEHFKQEKVAAMSLPAKSFDPCLYQSVKVDKYQSIGFDTNRYSVPRPFAFGTLSLKAYTDKIQLVDRDRIVADHPRSYQKGQWILDPLHYLTTLGRRPAALDHAPVYRNWKLPPVFTQLREQLEARLGSPGGCRQFVLVLRMLAEHPLERVQQAIEQTQPVSDAQAVIHRVERLAKQASRAKHEDVSQFNHQHHQIDPQVPEPDLRQYDELVPQTTGAMS